MRSASLLLMARTVLTAWVLALTGCGLVYDAVQWIYPIARDDLQRVCARQRLRVGISVEPFRPFVFPAVFTDEGVRITGMDVDLVRELASALGRWCGGGEPIVPTLHLVRVRDQFVELNENKLDLIVSAVTANVPLEQAAGIAYSIPYYDDGAIVGMARSRELVLSIRERLRQNRASGDGFEATGRVFDGLSVAVPELRSPYVYAKEHLAMSDLVLCDSLPAAFESQNPPVDVILGKLPVLVENAQKGNYKVHLDPANFGSDAPLRLNMSYEADAEIQKWLNNKDFRIAMSLGIQRDQLNEALWLGMGTPGSYIIGDDNQYSPGPGYRTKNMEYDPKRANEILDSIGLSKKDAEGYRVAIDSNYDWGQDLKRLARWVEARNSNDDPANHVTRIAVDYVGGGSPQYYLGDRFVRWNPSQGDPRARGLEYLAVSVNILQARTAHGRPQELDQFAGYSGVLDPHAPYDRAGRSLFIYRFVSR